MTIENCKLFYLLLGCTPAGRHTEQHDVFFCIGESLQQIKPQVQAFWPGAGKMHIDAWRELRNVDGFELKIISRQDAKEKGENLFFINLGGYLPGSFEEHHFKLLTVAGDMGKAVEQARQTSFYKGYNTTDKKGLSHVDNKYGVDVDEIFNVEEILPPGQKEQFAIRLTKRDGLPPDDLHIGYLKWSDF